MGRNGFRANFLLFMCSLGVVLLFAEGALRWGINNDNSFICRELFTIYDDKTLAAMVSDAMFSSGKRAKYIYSPDLGWDNPLGTPSLKIDRYTFNSSGMRAEQEYSFFPLRGKKRVMVFGDSFSFGSEVGDKQSFPAVLQDRDASLEVLNCAVAGYGDDQAYLKWKRMGGAYHPDIVIIGHYIGNIFRNVNRFPPFIGIRYPLPLGKPRYILDSGALKIAPNPVNADSLSGEPSRLFRDAGDGDFWFLPEMLKSEWISNTKCSWLLKYISAVVKKRLRAGYASYRAGYEPFLLSAAVISEFCRDVSRSGARPVVVFLPSYDDVRRVSNGEPVYWGMFLDYLRGKGIACIDICEKFIHDGGREWRRCFNGRYGHYTPFGNGIVAAGILERLRGVLDQGSLR